MVSLSSGAIRLKTPVVERRAVSDKQVGYIPGLTMLIQHRFFPISAHNGATDFVNNRAATGNRSAAIGFDVTGNFAAHAGNNIGEGFLHMRGLIDLML